MSEEAQGNCRILVGWSIHGNRSLCFEAPAHVLRARGARRVPRRDGHFIYADRHLSRDRHPRRDHHLAIYGAQHAGDGTAGHDL
jgi:hypothetical protein